jgi:hypothetical protein
MKESRGLGERQDAILPRHASAEAGFMGWLIYKIGWQVKTSLMTLPIGSPAG